MSTMGDTTAAGPYTGGGAQDASSTEQAKEKVQDTAQHAAGQARGQIRKQVDERSTQAGEQVSSTASDVRSVAQQLREQGKDQPAKLADQAAERAERVSNYLTRSDADRILHDAEDFGRRQPWLVIAGGALLGLAASRFLKASSTRRYDERFESSNRLPARTSDVSPTGAGLYTGTATRPGTATGTGPVTGTGETVPFTTPPVGPGSFEEGR